MTRLIKFNRSGQGVADWLNADAIRIINCDLEHAHIELADDFSASVTIDELNRIIAEINGAAPAAPAPAPKTTAAKIVSMTRDQTKNSGSPMWRCATEAGFMVNVFKHDDPLKDTFHLFWEAGYGGNMEAMNLGDTTTWTRDPVAVELVQNGSFWNVAKVVLRPEAAMPDEPEPDDEGESNE